MYPRWMRSFDEVRICQLQPTSDLQFVGFVFLVSSKMPPTEESKLQVAELHPSFAAEVTGVDFGQEIPADVFEELRAILSQGHNNNKSGCRSRHGTGTT